MTKSAATGLLPVGMTDVLPPFASNEASAVAKVLELFQSYDYQRVSPPLVEFEETLFPTGQTDLLHQTFRLIDPQSGKMMGIRADMTPQIGRIALTRLKSEPRPLRLAYAGAVLRLNGTQLNPDRQILQVGAELIGADTARADAEVILVAVKALEKIGLKSLTVDLNLPTLFPALCKDFGFDAEDVAVLAALIKQKDFSVAKEFLHKMGTNGKTALPVFETLFDAYGEGQYALDLLQTLILPDEAAAECHRLAQVINLLRQNNPDLSITVDVLENRGFEYHCGIGFSIYSTQKDVELGRGGRYIASIGHQAGEPAVGVTLLMSDILSVLEIPVAKKRVYIPVNVPFKEARQLVDQGYIVVFGIKNDGNDEARQMACDMIYSSGSVLPL